MNKDEGLNPSVSCGFSRTHETELEQHAPPSVGDPFTSSFSMLSKNETKHDKTS